MVMKPELFQSSCTAFFVILRIFIPLIIQIYRVTGISLNKFLSRLHLLAHEDGKGLIGLYGIVRVMRRKVLRSGSMVVSSS